MNRRKCKISYLVNTGNYYHFIKNNGGNNKEIVCTGTGTVFLEPVWRIRVRFFRSELSFSSYIRIRIQFIYENLHNSSNVESVIFTT